MLLWPIFGALIAVGPIVMFVGAQNLHAAHRPIKCGDKVMSQDGPYTCFTGYGPRDYDDLVRERHDRAEQAPYMLTFGALAVAIGVFGIRRATRHLGRIQRWATSSGQNE
ncbi:hypothetical protein DPM19_12470 [Actinomadura craniellae]|uniref:Uncharacterized protein n=1 Tax=Actinomadura craniellae TaxID=2231787 RepID=A0A365H665_9ACTN|nr:hypothetical protein [Actinomadura craniellae]RAY14581.1 hypothetical protein DPM19_12470 [Actinomadura craniellae]